MFTTRIVIWVILIVLMSYIGFLSAAYLLADYQKYTAQGFFDYEVRILEAPAWFVFTLLFFLSNGIIILREVILQLNWNQGGIGLSHPILRLLGANFITVPLLLFLFIILRAMRI